MPNEKRQVGCAQTAIAPDKHAAGWLVLEDTCCTSYPVATRVVVYKDGKKTVISPGQMIWEWRFARKGERIAVLTGPTHGWAGQAFIYDSRTGKELASWDGTGSEPEWAKGWADDFQNSK